MSDQAWIDKALERVAREIRGATYFGTAEDHKKQLLDILQRELGPLLEAGQACSDDCEDSFRIETWYAAKKNLLGGAK